MVDELRDSPSFKKKMRSIDRSFVLRPIEGKFTISAAGTVDERLYTSGGNNLHAKQLPTSLWMLYQEHGAVAPQLKQQFTNFALCERAVRDYYLKRNIELKEIKD